MAVRLSSGSGGSATAAAVYESWSAVSGTTYAPPLTVTMWFQLGLDRNALSAILQIYKSGQASAPFYSLMASSTSTGTDMSLCNGAGVASGTTSSMSVSTWYRLAVVSSSTTASTFYHGSATLTSAFTTGSLSGLTGSNVYRSDSQRINFGSTATGGGWNGRGAAIKVWDAALTQAEITNEFYRYRPIRVPNLIRWYPAIHWATSRNLQNDGYIYALDHAGQSPLGGLGQPDTTGLVTPTFEDGPPIPW